MPYKESNIPHYTAMLSLLAVFLLASSAAANCIPNSPTVFCGTTVLYILDYTNNCGPDCISLEIESIANFSLPLLGYGSGQEVGIMSYGGASLKFPTLVSSYPDICNRLDSLRTVLNNKDYGNTLSLTDLLQAVYNQYGNSLDNIILYTANTDNNDIAMAGAFRNKFLPNTRFTTIALLGWNGVWQEFGGNVLYSNGPDFLLSSAMGSCVAQTTCGGYTGCQSFYYTTTPAPAFTTPSPQIYQPCAECFSNKVSVDLVFLIDNSFYTGQDGLNQIQNFITKSFSIYNIQTANSSDPFHMRVGIYTYSDAPARVKALGTATKSDLLNLKLPFAGDKKATDVVDALGNIEKNEFGGPAHRLNAAKVIVLMASTFVEGNYRYPSDDFSAFVKKGGKVIVYELYKPHSNGYVLQTLTAPAYYINSSAISATTMMGDSLCEANCVCQNNTASFINDPNTGAPIAGCFTGGLTATNYNTAMKNCKAQGGIVAETQSFPKSLFVLGRERFATMYTGLMWSSIANTWVWADGRYLDNSYVPWASNGSHTPGQDCCIMTSDILWYQTDCRNAYTYVCQLPPCDTSRAC